MEQCSHLCVPATEVVQRHRCSSLHTARSHKRQHTHSKHKKYIDTHRHTHLAIVPRLIQGPPAADRSTDAAPSQHSQLCSCMASSSSRERAHHKTATQDLRGEAHLARTTPVGLAEEAQIRLKRSRMQPFYMPESATPFCTRKPLTLTSPCWLPWQQPRRLVFGWRGGRWQRDQRSLPWQLPCLARSRSCSVPRPNPVTEGTNIH